MRKTPEEMYAAIPLAECPLNSDGKLNAPAQGEPPLCSPAAKEFKQSVRCKNEAGVWTVYDRRYYIYNEQTRLMEVAPVTSVNYYEYLARGLYERTVELNTPAEGRIYLRHQGQTTYEDAELKELGVSFKPNEWLHIGVIANGNELTVALNDTHITFDRYSHAAEQLTVNLNIGANTFMLDELMVDTETAENLADFYEHTLKRIPWGKLPYTENHFVLTAENVDAVKTNLFNTDIFKQKVLEIINEYHNN